MMGCVDGVKGEAVIVIDFGGRVVLVATDIGVVEFEETDGGDVGYYINWLDGGI